MSRQEWKAFFGAFAIFLFIGAICWTAPKNTPQQICYNDSSSDQRTIDSTGNNSTITVTDEMRERARHLSPEQKAFIKSRLKSKEIIIAQ